MVRNLVALVCGALFGVGLIVGGMTQPSKVVGFLDVAGEWDLSLALVMAGAVSIHLVLFRVVMRRRSPILDGAFRVPTRRDIDARLVVGAGLFGLGWGLGGYCPGPVITSLPTLTGETIAHFSAMVAGMLAFSVFDAWTGRRREAKRSSEAVLTELAPESRSADA